MFIVHVLMDFGKTFVNTSAIILQYTDNSENMLLEFCGTYFRINRRRLEAMFEALVPYDFFKNEDKKSYSVLKLCNISDA